MLYDLVDGCYDLVDGCKQFKSQNLQSHDHVDTCNFQCGFEELRQLIFEPGKLQTFTKVGLAHFSFCIVWLLVGLSLLQITFKSWDADGISGVMEGRPFLFESLRFYLGSLPKKAPFSFLFFIIPYASTLERRSFLNHIQYEYSYVYQDPPQRHVAKIPASGTYTPDPNNDCESNLRKCVLPFIEIQDSPLTQSSVRCQDI